jgi:hypothetical protein
MVTTNPTASYSVGIAPIPINNSLDTGAQEKRYKEEELSQKAPKILPYNLDAMNELTVKLFGDLLTLRKMLIEAEKKPQVKSSSIQPILGVIDDIGNQFLQTIPELLEKLKL